MLLAIAVILFIAWAMGFLAFHVAGGLIHLLIVLAVISLVVHLLRRPGSLELFANEGPRGPIRKKQSPIDRLTQKIKGKTLRVVVETPKGHGTSLASIHGFSSSS